MHRLRHLLVPAVVMVTWTTSAGFSAAAQRGSFQQAAPVNPYTLSAQLDAILQRETTREGDGDCKNARTTFDENTCLGNAIQTTTANYKAYADTLRTLLRLQPPQSANDRFSGPTGAPPLADDMANEFDSVERAWDAYRTALCAATFHANQGGTIAPSMEGRCALEVIRAHMRELNATLRPELH